MQPTDASQQHASLGQPPPTFPPIPPVSPPAFGTSALPGPSSGIGRYSSAGQDSSRQRQDYIPSIEELRSTARGIARLNAPNLTTYIEHSRTWVLLEFLTDFQKSGLLVY